VSPSPGYARQHSLPPEAGVSIASCSAVLGRSRSITAAIAAAMNAAVIRALLYDMRYLGTKEYQMYEEELKFKPVIMCVDNSAAVAMSKSPKLNKKTRHIARHFHFVREGVKQGLHILKWISN